MSFLPKLDLGVRPVLSEFLFSFQIFLKINTFIFLTNSTFSSTISVLFFILRRNFKKKKAKSPSNLRNFRPFLPDVCQRCSRHIAEFVHATESENFIFNIM